MATFSLKHQQFLILSVCSLFYFQRQPTDESRFECFSYLISLSRCSRRGFKVLYFMISSQSEFGDLNSDKHQVKIRKEKLFAQMVARNQMLRLNCADYIGDFEYVDDHRSEKIVVELNGRLNMCGVISPRFDVGVKEIEGWTARLLPSRQYKMQEKVSFLLVLLASREQAYMLNF
ncbi:hypothetical protein KY290_023467 [Solanum tuberosum]|uniref:Uncharacterized protein n=1 Tax=Solanum tuberosum TaxID=4113 RepID=A0ABQ7V7E1_SOLTU|nr:hypothetical protein KY290_023467 [Solanum tuberosum]